MLRPRAAKEVQARLENINVDDLKTYSKDVMNLLLQMISVGVTNHEHSETNELTSKGN